MTTSTGCSETASADQIAEFEPAVQDHGARLVDAAAELDAADAELFEAFASEVAERLEAEHNNLLSALEWRTALDLD